MEMSCSSKDGQSIVCYTFPELTQNKFKKMMEDLYKLSTLIKTTKTSNLFCDFQYPPSNKNEIQIKVHQRNDFNAKAEGEPLDLVPLIKELSRGYLQLGRNTNIQSVITNWWKVLTIHSITLGRSLKINIVQGFLQSRSQEVEQSSGNYLADLLEKVVKIWEEQKKVRMEGVNREDLYHFFDLLREKRQFENRSQLNQLQKIIEKHPLFLSASEKRMLIHDASDFSQYLKNRYILDHYLVLDKTQRDNMAKQSDDWINYQAYIQDVDNNKEAKLGVYNWIKRQFANLVEKFNEINRRRVQNKEQKIYVTFKENSFKDQLRFFRNLLFHAYPYKQHLEEKLNYEHWHPDCLLEKIESCYPRLLTFIMERALLQQLLQQSQTDRIDLQLPNFAPRREVNLPEKMGFVFQQFLKFREEQDWDYISKHILGAEEVQKDIWMYEDLRDSLKNANLRVMMKLNQYKILFGSQAKKIYNFENNSIITHKDYNKFGALVTGCLSKPSILAMYLKIYNVIENRKTQTEQLMKDCLQANCLWVVYSALLSQVNCEEVKQKKLQQGPLGQKRCQAYFSRFCNDKQCPYFHPEGCCHHLLNNGFCPNPEKCEYYHPKFCREGDQCKNQRCKMHLPICYNFYYQRCIPKKCGSKNYHPPVGICINVKNGYECEWDDCQYYHPLKAEIPDKDTSEIMPPPLREGVSFQKNEEIKKLKERKK